MTPTDSIGALPRAGATFAGTGISPGFGMGPAWLVVDLLGAIPEVTITPAETAAEWARIQRSFEEARREIEESVPRVEAQFSAGLAGIFRAHAMMLDGILSSGEIEHEP